MPAGSVPDSAPHPVHMKIHAELVNAAIMMLGAGATPTDIDDVIQWVYGPNGQCDYADDFPATTAFLLKNGGIKKDSRGKLNTTIKGYIDPFGEVLEDPEYLSAQNG